MALSGSSVAECHPHERVTDPASELFIAESILNDVATVQTARKGKARRDAPRSDEEIAFDLQAASLRAFIGVLHDHQFASSIDRAIASDVDQLRRFTHLERAERDDHRAAVALGEGHDLPQQTTLQRTMEHALARLNGGPSVAHHRHASNTTKPGMGGITVGMENVHIAVPVVSETAPHQSFRNIDTGLECVICGDVVVAGRSFKAPCGHYHCRGCVVNLVELSLRDESLHPLRCCQQLLPLAPGVFRFISLSLRFQFLAKCREYSAPAGSRVYCSNPRCSTFLDKSGDTREDLTCDTCDTITCSQCKNNAHPGEDCSEHQSTLELRETATENKWQTCPGCHAIVELSQGCYHIICRCSTQFCYLCSARWKTCQCRQWDEDRLLNDAERRVRNEFGDRDVQLRPAAHAERVYQRMEELRENHECQLHRWRYRHGCGACEECGDFLPVFLMRCTHCQTLVCRRCSVNRL